MEDPEVNVSLQNTSFFNGMRETNFGSGKESEKFQGNTSCGQIKSTDAVSRTERGFREERIMKSVTVEDFLPVLVGVWMKMSPEIRHAYKILREIVTDKTKSVIEPFLSAVNSEEYPDYYDVIKEPMDLFKISEKFHDMEYASITEVVADIRQIIENCYKYNGVDSFISKQAHKLEVILEQKLNLLSRELRSKTTLAATNEVRNKEYLNSLLFTSGSRRVSLKPTNGERSLIAMQMHLQDELEEKERRRMKEKEKKEINDALEEECENWTKEVLNDEFMNQIASTWELPAVGIFIYILKDFLNIQDLNYSEFELGMLFPSKSSLVAKIFTSLLVTPFQRRKLNSKEPMEYSMWSEKVQTKVLSWYKVASTNGPEYTASLFGFDVVLFEVLGYVNPFFECEFKDLPLKSRMWILKALCEAALEQDSTMRDHFADLSFIDRQDLCLGSDSEGFSYHYISQFGTTDIRIYRQKTTGEPNMPKIKFKPIIMEKEEPPQKEVKPKVEVKEDLKTNEEAIEDKQAEDNTEMPPVRSSKRIRRKRSLSPPPVKPALPKKEKKTRKEACKDFQMIVNDINSLKKLFDKLDHQVKTKPSKRWPEKDLHQMLDALFVELKKREANFVKCNLKARTKVMLECRVPDEEANQPEDKQKKESGWESGNDEEYETESIKNDDTASLAKGTEEEMPPAVEYIENAVVTTPSEVSTELSKQGRRLRSKRFDVKQLFGEMDQPSRKRPKAHNERQTKQAVDNGRWTRLGLDQRVQDEGSQRKDGWEGQHGKKQSGAAYGTRRQSKVMSCGDISERDIEMLRNRRLEKMKNDLREGKLLKPEDERNLANLGLSVEDLKALKTNQLAMENGNAKDDGGDKQSAGTPFGTYDGLKALANIASLAQKQPPSAGGDGKKEVSVKLIVKRGNQMETKAVDCSGLSSVASLKSNSSGAESPAVSVASCNDVHQKEVIVVKKEDGRFNLEQTLLRGGEVKVNRGSQVIVVTKDKQLTPGSNLDGRANVSPRGSQDTNSTHNEQKSLKTEPASPTLAQKMSLTFTGSSENSPGKGKPLVLQRRRPNILRKPTVVVASATPGSEDNGLVASSQNAKQANVIVVRTKQNRVGLLSAGPGSRVAVPSASNSLESCSNVLSAAPDTCTVISSSLAVADPTTPTLGKEAIPNSRVNQPTKLQVSTMLTSQASGSNPLLNSKAGVTGGAGSVLVVSQGAQLLKPTGIPLVLGDASGGETQPVLILTAPQPRVNPGNLQHSLQQGNMQQRVVLQPNGDSCILAIQQQQPLKSDSKASVGNNGSVVMETGRCPVTTLKSKLHAAALKRKLHGKSRLEGPQNYLSIASKVNSPLPLLVENGSIKDGLATLQGNIVYKFPSAGSPRQKVAIARTPKSHAATKTDKIANIAPKLVQAVGVTYAAGTKSTLSLSEALAAGGVRKNNVLSAVAPSPALMQTNIHGSSHAVSSNADSAVNATKPKYCVPIVASSVAGPVISICGGATGLGTVMVTSRNTSVTTHASTSLQPTISVSPAANNNSNYSAGNGDSMITAPMMLSPALMKVQQQQPIKPAIKPAPTTTFGSPTDLISQVAPPIIVAPGGFALQPQYQATLPVRSLHAQIVQLPAQIPAKQVVKGPMESNRGVATAAQLVIVPQSRTVKEIRPANDSTTAVKALQSLDQVSKPGAIASSPIGIIATTTLETKASSSSGDLANAKAQSITAAKIDSVNQNATGTLLVGPKLEADGGMDVDLSMAESVLDSPDVQTLAAIKDRSSVTYSIVSPIPSVEIQGSEAKESVDCEPGCT